MAIASKIPESDGLEIYGKSTVSWNEVQGNTEIVEGKPISVGLAAYGMSGQLFHAPFIYTNPHFKLIAITERSKNLAQQRYPKTLIYRDVETMLTNDAIELVVINTPDSTHYEYAKKALLAGKHVILEKPLTQTQAEAEELIDIATRNQLMISVFQNRRWDSDFLTVQKIIKSGRLGRLVEFESTFPRYRNYIVSNTWKESGSLGGGLLYNLGAHIIDQAIQLFGMPESIYSDYDCLRTGGMVDDYFLMHFIYSSKVSHVKITLKSSYLMCYNEPRFVLHGTEGSFVKYGLDPQEAQLKTGNLPVGDQWGTENSSIWGTLYQQKGEQLIKEIIPSEKGDYHLFYDNVYEHLRFGKPLDTDARLIANGALRLIELAYAHNQETIKI